MSEAIYQKMQNAVYEYDTDKAIAAAKEVIAAKLDPLESIDKGFAVAIKEVGRKFDDMEIFLPHLIQASEAMQAGVKVLNDEILKSGGTIKTSGVVVIGTVEGDIHDIGKTIVVAMLQAAGYEVHDLGKDVPIPTFIDMAKKVNADVIGLSALLSTTLLRQKEAIEFLENEDQRERFLVVVGGAPVSQEWSDEIGADGFARDATKAVQVIDQLMKDKKSS
jgi:corrinoid protein of di/trimethylamine methyltransferase